MAGLRHEQGQCYGRFAGEPTQEQLAKYFHLDETERGRISRHHRNPNKLGFTVQQGTFRFIACRTPFSLAHPSFAASLIANQEEGR
ncbi:MAG: DUF4158 domain-containing protein [Bryobacterales bacterium]|nr:DUF4158 domain-containing protein [Bryobacterales bacterium]